jgi:uncharacterized protein YrzB (UPF0473 family)
MENEMENVITLIDDEGNEIECEIIDAFEYDDKEYVVLLPGDEEDPFMLRVDKDENGEEVFAMIEDDDEFDEVSEAYNGLLEEDDED